MFSDIVFSPGLHHMPTFSSNLIFLDLSMAECTSGTLSELFSVCSRLQKVSLEFLNLSNSALVNLGENSNIDTLNLSMCSGITKEGITHLLRKLVNLKHLNISWANLSNVEVTAAIGNLPDKLLSLNISGYRNSIGDEHIQTLCMRAPNIRELDISDCSEFSAHGLHHLSVHLPHLSILALNRCYGLQDDAYK